MLFFLDNRIERTFAVTSPGVCSFCLAKSKKVLVSAYYKNTASCLDGWLYVCPVTISYENTYTRK